MLAQRTQSHKVTVTGHSEIQVLLVVAALVLCRLLTVDWPGPLLSPAAAAAAHQVVLTAGLQQGGGMVGSGGQTE